MGRLKPGRRSSFRSSAKMIGAGNPQNSFSRLMTMVLVSSCAKFTVWNT